MGGIHGISVSAGTSSSYTIAWTNAAGATVGNTIPLTGVGAGSYTLTITDANNCTATLTTGLTVPGNPAVVAAFTPSPSQGTAPLTVGLTNNSSGATHYLWSFGNGSGATTMNATAVYPTAGVYTVTLVASNGSCFGLDTAVIIVNDATSIVIPNIFSPNGDGINDVFYIATTGMSSLHVDIFNRWGQLVYTLGSINQSWDGKLNNGNQATEGTYYFILSAVGLDGKTFSKEGPLTLVK
jgi:gliding motility-associated-like protein